MANKRVGKTEGGGRAGELTGIFVLGAALIVGLSVFSYSPLDRSLGSVSSSPVTHNLIGPFGSYLSDIIFQLLGGGGFLVPFYMLVYGVNRLTGKERAHRALSFLGAAVLVLSVSVLLRLRYEHLAFGGIRAGGWAGEFVSARLLVIFGAAGSYILTITLLLAGLVVSTTFSLASLARDTKGYLGFVHDRLRTLYLMYSARRSKARVRDVREEAEPSEPPEIVQPVKKPAPPPLAERLQEALPFKGADREFSLPPAELLADPPAAEKKLTKESLLMSSSILEKKLHDFGVDGKIIQVYPGPVVTMYEFEPAPGVKVNRISTLSDDLALAMRAESVRIVAPLPGKAAVGIEVPNNVREEVYFKEVLGSAEFKKSRSPLTLALGKDIYGMPVVSDLAKMPHLLIAGATGSGKSVAINTMTMSLLMNARPREMRLLMIDPKRLELSVYEGIPHLVEGVITEPRRAASSLRRVVVVMEERYKLLAEKGARNIEGYNAKALEEKKHPRLGEAREEGEGRPRREALANEDGTLPYIVVVIDELADLMMVASKEVEDSIARLAQMARASGIHLLMATQRPSVDVLTGVIKANFPARISFQVSSKTDSRTILDANGAEALLGKGDMLFLPPGTAKMTRIHGSFVSEAEIRAVVEFLRKQGKPQAEGFSAITVPAFEAGKAAETGEDAARDIRYRQAVDMVTSAGKASASLLQRRMRIGYPTAARMIEMMEEDGIVGPKKEGGKEREVLKKPPSHFNP